MSEQQGSYSLIDGKLVSHIDRSLPQHDFPVGSESTDLSGPGKDQTTRLRILGPDL